MKELTQNPDGDHTYNCPDCGAELDIIYERPEYAIHTENGEPMLTGECTGDCTGHRAVSKHPDDEVTY